METTEKVVEAYCRYIKGWATIPNIKCSGQYEIDLIAIDPGTLDRYHIETGVSISSSFSKLTAKDFSPQKLKTRVLQPGQRRTVGYFSERKFGAPEVAATLRRYGFKKGQYSKVVVTWGWTDEAKVQADQLGITLWDFRSLLIEIGEAFGEVRTYFTDDTMRTLQLFLKALNASAAKNRSAEMPTAEDFRAELARMFREAMKKKEAIEIRAGDLHHELGGYPGPGHRLSVCCSVMKAEMRHGDKIVAQPPKGKGASLVIRYVLPRSQQKLPLKP